MKRSVIFVSVFSIGIIVIFSLVGVGLVSFNQRLKISCNDIKATLEYKIDFEYCKSDCEEPEYIDIQVIGKKVNIKQVLDIYCNAYANNFWLEGFANSSIIVIRLIFDPDGLVTQCDCPIKITGVLKNISIESFTLKFVLVNNYVYQNETLGIFPISL
ncbi:MAG: hypothetical protein FK733_06110 [Asgard group archaeon]|nr:hypothetical protein [Asgard group archaeon]